MSFNIKKYGDPKKATREATEKGLMELGARITAQAKQLAPVDMGIRGMRTKGVAKEDREQIKGKSSGGGQLKNSIMWKVGLAEGGNNGGPKLKTWAKQMELIVGTAVEHGIYNEFGTRTMEAEPFLGPAVKEVVKSTIMKELAEIQKSEMIKELK